jgi:hypothetical protein
MRYSTGREATTPQREYHNEDMSSEEELLDDVHGDVLSDLQPEPMGRSSKATTVLDEVTSKRRKRRTKTRKTVPVKKSANMQPQSAASAGHSSSSEEEDDAVKQRARVQPTTAVVEEEPRNGAVKQPLLGLIQTAPIQPSSSCGRPMRMKFTPSTDDNTPKVDIPPLDSPPSTSLNGDSNTSLSKFNQHMRRTQAVLNDAIISEEEASTEQRGSRQSGNTRERSTPQRDIQQVEVKPSSGEKRGVHHSKRVHSDNTPVAVVKHKQIDANSRRVPDAMQATKPVKREHRENHAVDGVERRVVENMDRSREATTARSEMYGSEFNKPPPNKLPRMAHHANAPLVASEHPTQQPYPYEAEYEDEEMLPNDEYEVVEEDWYPNAEFVEERNMARLPPNKQLMGRGAAATAHHSKQQVYTERGEEGFQARIMPPPSDNRPLASFDLHKRKANNRGREAAAVYSSGRSAVAGTSLSGYHSSAELAEHARQVSENRKRKRQQSDQELREQISRQNQVIKKLSNMVSNLVMRMGDVEKACTDLAKIITEDNVLSE